MGFTASLGAVESEGEKGRATSMSKEHIAITAGTLRELFAATLSSAQQFAFLELEQHALEIGQEVQTKAMVRANAVIETLRAQIGHLKEAKPSSDPEIAVGSWWRRREAPGVPARWYKVVDVNGDKVQTTYGAERAGDPNCNRLMAPFDAYQLWEFCEPCDPPEWYEADKKGEGQ